MSEPTQTLVIENRLHTVDEARIQILLTQMREAIKRLERIETPDEPVRETLALLRFGVAANAS